MKFHTIIRTLAVGLFLISGHAVEQINPFHQQLRKQFDCDQIKKYLVNSLQEVKPNQHMNGKQQQGMGIDPQNNLFFKIVENNDQYRQENKIFNQLKQKIDKNPELKPLLHIRFEEYISTNNKYVLQILPLAPGIPLVQYIRNNFPDDTSNWITETNESYQKFCFSIGEIFGTLIKNNIFPKDSNGSIANLGSFYITTDTYQVSCVDCGSFKVLQTENDNSIDLLFSQIIGNILLTPLQASFKTMINNLSSNQYYHSLNDENNQNLFMQLYAQNGIEITKLYKQEIKDIINPIMQTNKCGVEFCKGLITTWPNKERLQTILKADLDQLKKEYQENLNNLICWKYLDPYYFMSRLQLDTFENTYDFLLKKI